MTTSKPSTSDEERQLLLDAALAAVREHGTGGLRVGHVLDRAGLGTRAFYRHFASKDHLVLTVFADAARAEAERLRGRMPPGAGPWASVVAWIDGRLDLAFDTTVRSDLKLLSRQAQALNAVDPDTTAGAHAVILTPLAEQIARGVEDGTFPGADPAQDAASIDAVTWAAIERQWASGGSDRAEVRAQLLRFCLRGLGAEA